MLFVYFLENVLHSGAPYASLCTSTVILPDLMRQALLTFVLAARALTDEGLISIFEDTEGLLVVVVVVFLVVVCVLLFVVETGGLAVVLADVVGIVVA